MTNKPHAVHYHGDSSNKLYVKINAPQGVSTLPINVIIYQ